MSMKVAQPWFELHQYSNDITLVREPHVLGGAFTNMWHVRGRDCDLLLDSGMGVLSLREHVALLSERPVICVASHTHFDHIGGHHEFEQRVVHEAEADILASVDPVDTVLEGYREHAFDALPYEGFEPSNYAITPAPATRSVREGDIIDLGDRHFEVRHLPGHSPGSIVLWEQATATLISGDVITQGKLLDELYHSDSDAYVDSLGRIRNLSVDIVLPGHYEPFGRQRFVELIDNYVATKKRPMCPSSPVSRS
jgi:glyoxylase-like metal-dependent hydrolase (beta-lactamase superfamily II)